MEIPNQRVRAQLEPKLNSNVNVTVDDGKASANAQGAKVDIQLGAVHARAQGAPVAPKQVKMKECDRAVLDVHIATPNGISNHLYVEVAPKTAPATPKNAVTTATTTHTVKGNTTTTTTKFETTPPGTALPPLTVLPMGTNWPQATVLAPGPITGAPTGSIVPGLVPTPTPTPAASLTLSPSATPMPPPVPLPTTTPPAAPPTNITSPPALPAPTAPAPAAAPTTNPTPLTGAPTTSSARPSLPAGGVYGQVEVVASTSSGLLGLPPLPPIHRKSLRRQPPMPRPPGGSDRRSFGESAYRIVEKCLIRSVKDTTCSWAGSIPVQELSSYPE